MAKSKLFHYDVLFETNIVTLGKKRTSIARKKGGITIQTDKRLVKDDIDSLLKDKSFTEDIRQKVQLDTKKNLLDLTLLEIKERAI